MIPKTLFISENQWKFQSTLLFSNAIRLKFLNKTKSVCQLMFFTFTHSNARHFFLLFWHFAVVVGVSLPVCSVSHLWATIYNRRIEKSIIEDEFICNLWCFGKYLKLRRKLVQPKILQQTRTADELKKIW